MIKKSFNLSGYCLCVSGEFKYLKAYNTGFVWCSSGSGGVLMVVPVLAVLLLLLVLLSLFLYVANATDSSRISYRKWMLIKRHD